MKSHKRIRVAVATLSMLAACSFATAADDHKGHDHGDKKGGAHAHDAKATHGGVVAVVKDVNYELVAKGDTLQLYVADHGKPVELKGATAKVTLLSATGKEDVVLAPAGDRLEGKATNPIKAGTKAAAAVSMPGGSATTVRFVVK